MQEPPERPRCSADAEARFEAILRKLIQRLSQKDCMGYSVARYSHDIQPQPVMPPAWPRYVCQMYKHDLEKLVYYSSRAVQLKRSEGRIAERSFYELRVGGIFHALASWFRTGKKTGADDADEDVPDNTSTELWDQAHIVMEKIVHDDPQRSLAGILAMFMRAKVGEARWLNPHEPAWRTFLEICSQPSDQHLPAEERREKDPRHLCDANIPFTDTELTALFGDEEATKHLKPAQKHLNTPEMVTGGYRRWTSDMDCYLPLRSENHQQYDREGHLYDCTDSVSFWSGEPTQPVRCSRLDLNPEESKMFRSWYESHGNDSKYLNLLQTAYVLDHAGGVSVFHLEGRDAPERVKSHLKFQIWRQELRQTLAEGLERGGAAPFGGQQVSTSTLPSSIIVGTNVEQSQAGHSESKIEPRQLISQVSGSNHEFWPHGKLKEYFLQSKSWDRLCKLFSITAQVNGLLIVQEDIDRLIKECDNGPGLLATLLDMNDLNAESKSWLSIVRSMQGTAKRNLLTLEYPLIDAGECQSHFSDYDNFYVMQYRAWPVEFNEGKVVRQHNQLHELPILSEQIIATGGSGATVYRCTLAPGAFPTKHGHERIMVRKHFRSSKLSGKESNNESLLAKYLSDHPFKHKHLLLARVVVEHPDGSVSLIMDDAKEGDLYSFMGNRNPSATECSPAVFLPELAHLTNALCFLHTGFNVGIRLKKVAHLDIAPGNIFVDRSAENRIELYIGDYHTARIIDARVAGTGTPHKLHFERQQVPSVDGPYRAPEWDRNLQMSDEDLFKVDVFSLGCVLIEVLIWMGTWRAGLTGFRNDLQKERDIDDAGAASKSDRMQVGRFYQRYGEQGHSFRLKKAVLNHLARATQQISEDGRATQIATLILDCMVQVDPLHRDPIAIVHDKLEVIIKSKQQKTTTKQRQAFERAVQKHKEQHLDEPSRVMILWRRLRRRLYEHPGAVLTMFMFVGFFLIFKKWI